MPDSGATDDTSADGCTCNRADRIRSLAWEVVAAIAGLVLALLSAPAFWP